MMPAVNYFERRLGILKQVEPVIENAIKKLSSAIDLTGSPLGGKVAKAPPPPKQEEEMEAPAEELPSPAGLDLSALLAGMGGAAAAPEPEPAAPAGLDLSMLLA